MLCIIILLNLFLFPHMSLSSFSLPFPGEGKARESVTVYCFSRCPELNSNTPLLGSKVFINAERIILGHVILGHRHSMQRAWILCTCSQSFTQVLLCLSPSFSISAALEIWPYDKKGEEFKRKINHPETKELKYLVERCKDLPKP